jgi:hypothetical protein
MYVNLFNARQTEQFLSASVEKDGKWLHLGRYFDPPSVRFNPEKVAEFLGMKVDDVFPISYDLRPHVIGNAPPVFGTIVKDPQRLTKEERSALNKKTPEEIEYIRKRLPPEWRDRWGRGEG